MIELTCPWEDRLDISREYKSNKYAPLISDLQQTGHKVTFLPLEIGVRGIINKANEKTLKIIHKFCKQETNFKSFKDLISKSTVCASYFIFLCRDQKEWDNVQ